MTCAALPRNIALILTEFPPSFGGMQTHAEFLASALQAAGYRICVYTYRCDDPALSHAAADFDRDCGYPVRRVLSRIGFWANLDLLSKRIAQDQAELIYASNVYYGGLGAMLKLPVICRSVGNDVQRPWIAYPFRFASRWLSHPSLEKSLHRWYRRWNSPEWLEALLRRQRLKLMQHSACAHQRILANSAYTRDLLQASGVKAQRVQILSGGVDSQRFQPNLTLRLSTRAELGLSAEAPILLTACRLVAKKGLDFLLGQVLALRQIAPGLQLLIVGDGRELRRCKAQLSALGCAKAVIFLGRVPQAEIQRYYAAADYFVLASRVTTQQISGFQDAETMGRVLCEANAAGIPLIASRSGGIPSVVRHEDNGLLFESDNAADFLQQFQRIYHDPVLRQRLIESGLARAKQEFDWSVLIPAHEACFAEVLSASQ
ncbi:glycosyltransferase family 4 protein [Iodobacter sp. CM08]|uniref:glycosyltransferase family 4 protein n=1 Tax=Iodobacter sp. CM08 TaxID=3085902 RepID=UPI00298267F3|nr:glycosyltransferase family 4 protein [Iodobacter sp. CM08]MDW5418785.1 glycosyltransferase family 4 protein [Iodobacter sp. CM08]